MITTTVGDILDTLGKYDRSTPVVVCHPNAPGYNRVPITRTMVYRIMVNMDNSLPCDFVDSPHSDLPDSFCAIVL